MKNDTIKWVGSFKPVLETIQKAQELGLWVEVVTLVIPGFNDSNEELWETEPFHHQHFTGYSLACYRLPPGL